jgi:hypothetical protein
MRLTCLSRRTTVLGLALAIAFVFALASGTYAQAPAAQQPQGRVFATDAGLILNYIKPDKTADFEMVMAKLKEALQKSPEPGRKEQAAGWKLFKAAEPGPSGSVLYIFMIDPAAKGPDYTVSKILSEVFPTEIADLYKKFSEAYQSGQIPINLTLVSAFGKP